MSQAGKQRSRFLMLPIAVACLAGFALLLQPIAILMRFAIPGDAVVTLSLTLMIASPILATVASLIGWIAWMSTRESSSSSQANARPWLMAAAIAACGVTLMTLIDLAVYPAIFAF